MDIKTIEKYKKKTTAQLKAKAIKVFHAYIRKRDAEEPCINCGTYRKHQAGHYFPAGKFERLRFNPDNTNGECVQCNYFNSQSHAYGYKPNLIKKIGKKRFQKLELIASDRTPFKTDRFSLIEVIEEYKDKI